MTALPSKAVFSSSFGRAAHRDSAEREQARVLDYSPEELDAFRDRQRRGLPELGRQGLRNITWFLPAFVHPFGGIHTILRFGELLRRNHGVSSDFVVYDNPQVTAAELETRVSVLYPEPPGRFHVLRSLNDLPRLPKTDLALATLASSAYLLPRFPQARAYAYFIQDFETSFHPRGTAQTLTDHTYRLGLYGIFNTRGLHDAVCARHPMQGTWFEPTVDREIFHARRAVRAPGAPLRIFFYARPSSERNGFELGLSTARELKRRFGAEVEIVTAGEQWTPEEFGATGLLKNLGVLPYENTAELYRSCDVGLCFMFTRHPSYLPLELMACGAAVVTNENPANGWLLEDGKNCLLAAPTPQSVADKISRLISDSALRERLSLAGAARVVRTSWDEQVARVYGALVGAH